MNKVPIFGSRLSPLHLPISFLSSSSSFTSTSSSSNTSYLLVFHLLLLFFLYQDILLLLYSHLFLSRSSADSLVVLLSEVQLVQGARTSQVESRAENELGSR